MIAIVDYGMGNLGSMANMFKRVGAPAIVSSEARVIEAAERLVLPGVGAFDHGMSGLAERGLVELLSRKVLEEQVPILGVCLGLQLFTRGSEEGALPGLGWIDASTVRFEAGGADSARLRIPHMGWNDLRLHRAHPVLDDLPPAPRFYFVHSYHLRCDDRSTVLTTSVHGYEFVSGIASRNLVGFQFHPEKSHKFGMQLIRNFVGWRPC